MYLTDEVIYDIKKKTGIDFLILNNDELIYSSFNNNEFDILETIDKEGKESIILKNKIYQDILKNGTKLIKNINKNDKKFSLVLNPIISYDGEIIGILIRVMSEKTLLHDIKEIQEEYIEIGTLLLILGVLGSFILSHDIGRPIEYMKSSMVKMRMSGVLGKIIMNKAPKEILRLADTFNDLIEELNKKTTENKI